MTALEIRPEEIGFVDLAAIKARRERLWNLKAPPQTGSSRRVLINRLRHPSDRTLYGAPIGPMRFTGRDWLNIATPPSPNVGHAKQIIKEICDQYNVTKLDLISDRRTKNLTLPRFHVAYRLRHETTLSYPQIGKMLGGRDHTTAIAAVRRFQALLDAGKVSL